MNRKQAIETLKGTINKLTQRLAVVHGDEIKALQSSMTALDDTYEGFSNRETCAVVQDILNNNWANQHFKMMTSPSWGTGTPAKNIQNNYTDWYMDRLENSGNVAHVLSEKIGSLWRVNWDEVAEALKIRD